MNRRPTFTDRRRAQLARRVAALETMESRSMITESLGIFAAGIGLSSGVIRSIAAAADVSRQQVARPQTPRSSVNPVLPFQVGRRTAGASRSSSGTEVVRARPLAIVPAATGDWLPLVDLSSLVPSFPNTAQSRVNDAVSSPASAGSGGALGSSHGGSGATTPGVIQPFRMASLDAGPMGTATALLMANSTVSEPALMNAGTPETTRTTNPFTSAITTSSPGVWTSGIAPGGSSGFGLAYDPGIYSISQNGSEAALAQFTNFPLYTLDYNNGVVLFPGQYQQATLGGSVDLRAQVRDTTVVSYSWDTSHLTHASSITGTGTYRLQFNWNAYNNNAAVDYATLTVTDDGSNQEVQTYYFQVPSSNVVTLPSSASWSEAIAPDLARGGAAIASPNVSVDLYSGSLDTTMPLPSYNPNVPALALTYDSLAADPRPIFVDRHIIDPAQAVPAKVSAQLTFNGTTGTAWYYDTSQFNAGAVQQMALQATPASPTTGRYSYSIQVVDYRTTNTTMTVSGSSTLLSYTNSAFGSGWTLQGLQKITTATGGVILDLGTGGKSLWFASSGGTYTSPTGEFSTLVLNGGGTYTRTLTDGTQINFDASGYETSVVDLNGRRTTFAYSSGLLSTVTDPYNDVTTFTYSSGKLQTIQDPAGRLTTFTISGGTLNQVQKADSTRVTYTYDGSGRLTQVKDERSNAVTIVYDGAQRVGTITRPDGSTESVAAYQVSGWTNAGTSGSPAPATLLAEARATHTDPNGFATDLRTDWLGLGLSGQTTDPDGNVTTYDRNASGLAVVSIDRINRISQSNYDGSGNLTRRTYPDLNSDAFTYNGYAEALTHTDANNHTTTNTYDANGNLTVIEDPLNNRTTMTYTGTGKVATVKDANTQVTSYQYDSRDRLTTVTYPDSSTRKYAYDSKGTAGTVTDERGNATTYSFDALNRTTGMTDALGNRTTYVYDAGGNLTATQAPLSRTTTLAYDAMGRVTTITDPLSHSTVRGYDSGGRLRTLTDPLSRVTTIAYDAEGRPTEITDPLGHRTTMTYDAEGQRLTVTDPLGRVTTTTYNLRGWAATVTDPMTNVATYVYSATGQMTTQYLYQSGQQFQAAGYTYDANDRATVFSDGLGHLTTSTYDAVGNRLTTKDANSNTTTFAYDSRNRLTTVTDALSHSTVVGYDLAGNRQTVSDGLGHVTTTLYDALNRATTITNALGATTTIAYDAAGRRTGLTDPVGNQTQWAYDAADRLTTMTDPLSHAVTYVYDNVNQLTDTTDRNGRRTTYAYDSGGRRTAETWVAASPSRTITYTYDSANELTGVTDLSATLTFTYDDDGRLSSAATSGSGTGQPTVTLSYGYDQQGNRTSRSDSLGSQGLTTYSYDLAQRLTTITTSYGGTTGPQVKLTYDNANRLTNVSRWVTTKYVNTTITYDNANRVGTIVDYSHVPSTMHSGYVDTMLATHVYGYDNADRVTSQVDAEGTASFTYDNANQLTGVSGSRAETYTYDSGGNRTMTGYTTGTGNELTAISGYTYTYDNEGNLTGQTNTSSHVATTYTYDYRNRLTAVNVGGTLVATYVYDAMNRRVGFQDNGTQTWTVYDGRGSNDNPYADFNGSGTLLQGYLYGQAVDSLLARTDSGGTLAWYLTDRLGTVKNIASTAGSVIDHLSYDSFGTVLTESNSGNGDRFKFTSRELDSTTGLYTFRTRSYNATIGRFVSQDPSGFVGGDFNLYRYVGNGPTNATDPTGLYAVGSTNNAAYQQYMQEYVAHQQLQRSIWDSMTGGDPLNTIDAVAAGIADSLTSGLSTRFREYMYGEIAKQNHEGIAFIGGQWVGTGIGIGLGGGNPCAMGRSTGNALRAINGLQSAGDAINAYEAMVEGRYAEAFLSGVSSVGSAKEMMQSCFAAGTPLLTPNGYKSIEKISVGDFVLSLAESDPDGTPIPKRVVGVMQNYSPILALRVRDKTIRTTAEHPFWVRGRGWIAAHQLNSGDLCRSHEGGWVQIDAIDGLQESATVYNVQVAEYHTYFIGCPIWGFSIWAHNARLCSLDYKFGEGFDDELKQEIHSRFGYKVVKDDPYVSRPIPLQSADDRLGNLNRNTQYRFYVDAQHENQTIQMSVNYDAEQQLLGTIKPSSGRGNRS